MKQLINKERCIELNPYIKFLNTKKLYFKKYLYRVEAYMTDSSYRDNTRSTNMDPFDYELFCDNFCENRLRWTDGGKLHRDGDECTYRIKKWAVSAPVTITVNLKVLFNKNVLLSNMPANIKASHMDDSFFLYGNDSDELLDIILQLGVDNLDIKNISGPSPAYLDYVIAGKEVNAHAKDYGFKLFFKPFAPDADANLPLLTYLQSLNDSGEIKLLESVVDQLTAAKLIHRIWSESNRTYIYIKDEKVIPLIMMLCGNNYSNTIELAMPIK